MSRPGKRKQQNIFPVAQKKLWQQFLKGMNVKIFYPSSRKKHHFKMLCVELSKQLAGVLSTMGNFARKIKDLIISSCGLL